MVVTKIGQTDQSPHEPTWMDPLLVCGRHSTTGENTTGSHSNGNDIYQHVDQSGHPSQCRKVDDSTISDNKVLGAHDSTGQEQDCTDSRENNQDDTNDPPSIVRQQHNSQMDTCSSRSSFGQPEKQREAPGATSTVDEMYSSGLELCDPESPRVAQAKMLGKKCAKAKRPRQDPESLPFSSHIECTEDIQTNKRQKVHHHDRCFPPGLGGQSPEDRPGDPVNSTNVDSVGDEAPHHTIGGHSICTSIGDFPSHNPQRQQCDHQGRCNQHDLGMEKGIEKTNNQQRDRQSCTTSKQQRRAHRGRIHSRRPKQTSRLLEQTSRLSKLPTPKEILQHGMQDIQLQTDHRFICKSTKPTNQSILQLAHGPPKCRKCIQHRLVKGKGLAKSTMGNHRPVLEKNPDRQSHSTSMFAHVEVSPLVERGHGIEPSTSIFGGEKQTDVPKPRRAPPPISTLGNPFHCPEPMTKTKLRQATKMLESQHDIPIKWRLEWTQQAMREQTDPMRTLILKQSIKRLKSNKSKPRYPIFYKVQPLIDWAFEDNQDPKQWNQQTILDKLIIQLRLTTLMRSYDLAQVVWGLFEQDENFYIKTTTKMGQIATFSVTGKTLATMLHYMSGFIDKPALFLLRPTKNPHVCLGAERIAKRALNVMREVGVNTEVFKAHSIRGAAATHLMSKNVPQNLVQSRGGWTSSATLDKYYSRLHQEKNWEELLGGTVGARHSSTCAGLSPKCPQHETDKGRWSGGHEGKSTAQEEELRAHGVLRNLYDTLQCPACGLDMPA